MAEYHSCIATPDQWKRTCDWALRALRSIGASSVVFTGMSGSSVGFYVANKLGIPWGYVRKKEENSHGCCVELPPHSLHLFRSKGYVFLDDFLSTGRTFFHVASLMWHSSLHYQTYRHEDLPDDTLPPDILGCRCVGIVQYNGDMIPCIDDRQEMSSGINQGTYHVSARFRVEGCPLRYRIYYPPWGFSV